MKRPLMDLLARWLPVLTAVQHLDAAERRADAARERRRRGPTVYNERRRCMEYARAGD